jgi:ATP-binding cassette subfamily B protein
VGTAAVFWVGGMMVIDGTIDDGVVVMFSVLVAQLYGPLSAITNSRVEFATSLVSFERVFEVLDLETDIPEPSDPVPLTGSGRVEFENVSFRYQSGEPEGLAAVQRFSWHRSSEGTGVVSQAASRQWALKDVGFVAEPGTLTALVGPSGAGKTTISYLVPRLYDVTRGRVVVNGVDVREVALQDLASTIGVVTQETYLFHDTIAANMRYARPDATQEELVAAAKAANIDQMIDRLPDGYETIVGERGYRLSGGEKQRIAIARVVLEDPSVLILDEATSHLDSRSEALIQEALEKLMKGRTSIVIAHRLSTVRAADQILVIDEGRIVERGSHEQLVARNGLYAELSKTQFTAMSA